jgi:toxin-antitoxin system PIN domain toxin
MSMPWLPDVNIWLALSLPGHVHHVAADQWFTSIDRSAYFCRASEQGLLRLLTTSAVMTPYNLSALSNRKALQHLNGFHSLDRVLFAREPESINAHWHKLADVNTASPKLWMDAYLAAFAITGGFRLVTTDKAFKQFKGLNVLVL